MFVRFRQTRTRLQVSLIQTRRIDGRVRHEHIAGLGSVETPLSVADRLLFWRRLHERLAKLGNRIDAALQDKILGEIHARIPMVTVEEQQALLDNPLTLKDFRAAGWTNKMMRDASRFYEVTEAFGFDEVLEVIRAEQKRAEKAVIRKLARQLKVRVP